MRSWWWVCVALPLHLATSKPQRCGVIGVSNKVVGGENASTPYPWFVALASSDSGSGSGSQLTVVCAASIVAPRFLLTAAHCYAEYPKSKWLSVYKLIYWLENRCEGGEVETEPRASGVELHARYRTSALMFDIALVTLAHPVARTPLCLPPPNKQWREGEVVGFGSAVPRAGGGRYPCLLQRAQVPILSRRQCLRTGIGPTVRSLSGVLCAGAAQGGVDTCDGDSGGPLQVIDNGRYFLRGIVSFGYGCGRRDMPGVYTDVVSYLDWIRTRTQAPNAKPTNRPLVTLPGFFNIPAKVPWIINSLLQ